MKFEKSDIPKMGLAAIGTVVIFIIAFFATDYRLPTDRKERISWDTKEKMTAEYLNYIPMKTEYVDAAGKTIKTNLKGFRFDAKAIDEVINHNQYGIGDEKADSMMIYFGKEGFIGSGTARIPNYKIVVVGIKDGKVMKNSVSSNVKESSVMDRADPCPPNCPK